MTKPRIYTIISAGINLIMDSLNIDLLRFQKRRHRKKKIVAGFMTIVFLILGSAFMSFKLFYAPKELRSETGFFQSLSHLMLSADFDIMRGKRNLNILVLGMGGEGHDGPYLTDTMLLVSINKSDKKLAITSIPRDLLVDTSRFGKQKINALDSYAEVEKSGSGGKYTRGVLEELLQVPIDYYARVDFNGFEKIIDAVGGVEINVQNSFSDPLYPRISAPALTTTVTFEKGLQHMDGKTALIYARSRHGNNGEGSDFARSRRQQQIILALKNKVLTSEILFSPSKLKNLAQSLKEYLDTDINVWETVQLVKTYTNLNIATGQIAVNVLTNGPTGPLYSTYYNNQYVLLPKKSDWSDIKNIVANPFDQKIKNYTGNYANTDTVSLMILNGTETGGLATIVAASLEEFGYAVKKIDNATDRTYEKNVIYNIAVSDKQDALQQLKKILNANVSSATPEWLNAMIKEDNKPDFVIVTGQAT